jgi:hypothetical protein
MRAMQNRTLQFVKQRCENSILTKAPLKGEFYMKAQLGFFVKKGQGDKEIIWKLKRSAVYSLKQSECVLLDSSSLTLSEDWLSFFSSLAIHVSS